MCGFAGIIDFAGITTKESIKNSIDLLHHRGPDDEGIEHIVSDTFSAFLAFKRLSVIDLSSAGHQPMYTPEKDIFIVFNGEVYNYRYLRKELLSDGIKFKSESDTEVILYLYKKYGISFLSKLNGMFAISLLDLKTKKLFLIRDRVGVKPLYYKILSGRGIMFASEIKSLLPLDEEKQEIDYPSVFKYFSYGYIPAPDTIFKGIKKLLPAHYLEYDISAKNYKTASYWTIKNTTPPSANQHELTETLESLLKDSFGLRMVSDVPVGIFLSGGYDSTAVAALLQSESSARLRTFTIGFEDSDYNEATYAERIAQHIGSEHTTLYCKSQDAIELVPKLPYFYDEPFGDSSSIPTMLVSKLARKHVTVSLSADGGDELFAGYQRHLKAVNQIQKVLSIPDFLKSAGAGLSRLIPHQTNVCKHDFGSKLFVYLTHQKPSRLFLNQLSVFSPKQIQSLLSSTSYYDTISSVFLPDFPRGSILSEVLLTDFYTYLPEDILTKVDRATMSASLEGREPLLDYRLVEFAFSLPDDFKIKNGHIQKAVLKKIVHKYIPKELIERPKMGFGIPIHRWLRKELKWLLDESFDGSKIKRQDFFNPKVIKRAIQSFLQGDKNIDHQRIWFLLMFQMWFDRWVDNQR
ncbi:MAG: asparagine synthase (glutamine-hydrolyzing) [Thermaurantimonas sp.]